jgi:thiamine biosynthesis lipoprotein
VIIDRPATPWSTAGGAAMGSRWRAVVAAGPPGLGAWIGDEIARLERSWSRFDPTSELRRAEADATTRTVAISRPLATAIARALELADVTDGLFDPTVGSCLRAIGYDRTFALVPKDAPTPVRAVPAAGADSITLDRAGPTLRLRPGTELDLGGLGKGLAADMVVAGALDRGATSACVGIGGDIRVGGVVPDGGWRVPVDDPAGGPARVVTLAAERSPFEAVVTSSTGVRRWRRAGTELHHLVVPTTGAPAATSVRAVVAVAGDAWFAEGVAKAALVAGPVRGAALMRRAGVGGWIVHEAGRWTRIGSPS